MAVLIGFANLLYAQTTAEKTVNEPKQIEVVMRMSKQLVDELIDDKIEGTVPISRQAQGVPVRGQARGEATPTIRFAPVENSAKFVVIMNGTVTASFNADAGPASVDASTRATFTSRKQFMYDGKTFDQRPAQTQATNCTTIDRICSRRRGPIGRVVRCVAGKMISRAKPEIDKSVNEATNEILTNKFDESGKTLADELNQIDLYAETIDKYFPSLKGEHFHFRTTSSQLLTGVGPVDAVFPSFLLEEPNGERAALLEIWIRTTPVEAFLVKMLADWEVAHDLLKEFLPEDEAKELADNLKLETKDGWTVLQVGVGIGKSKSPTKK